MCSAVGVTVPKLVVFVFEFPPSKNTVRLAVELTTAAPWCHSVEGAAVATAVADVPPSNCVCSRNSLALTSRVWRLVKPEVVLVLKNALKVDGLATLNQHAIVIGSVVTGAGADKY